MLASIAESIASFGRLIVVNDKFPLPIDVDSPKRSSKTRVLHKRFTTL